MSFLGSRNINIEKFGSSEDPDLVYYNCDIINGADEDRGNGTQPLARFNETRDTAIIHDTSKYYFSIVRFTLNGSDVLLPQFVPRIQLGTGQTNPNLTIYTLSLEMTANYTIAGNPFTETFRSTKPVIWQPQVDGVSAPIPPSGGFLSQDLSTPYYYAMTYQHWVDLVNQTYFQAYVDIRTQFQAWWIANGGASPAPALNTLAPKMKYDPSSKRFHLLCDITGWGGATRTSAGTTTDENWNMYFNSNMYGLFKGFPNQRLGGDIPTSNSKGLQDYAYEIKTEDITEVGDTIVEYTTSAGASIKWFKIEQDYVSSGTLWSPIGSLVFISTLIPIHNEQTGAPVAFGDGNVVANIGSQSAFQPIITDIALFNSSADVYKEFVQYVPSAEYRLSTMSNSKQEVRSIDIQVYWKNRLDGQLYPIYLYNQSSISVKVMFRRRDYER